MSHNTVAGEPHAERMVAALNISGQANRTSAKVMQETMLPSLLAAARQISSLI